jgi:hypothetical protein
MLPTHTQRNSTQNNVECGRFVPNAGRSLATRGIGLPPIPRPLQLFFLAVAYSSNFRAGNSTGHGCYFGCRLHRVCALAINIQRLEIRHLRISTDREPKKVALPDLRHEITKCERNAPLEIFCRSPLDRPQRISRPRNPLARLCRGVSSFRARCLER